MSPTSLRTLAAVFALFAPVALPAQSNLPRAPGARVVTVTAEPGPWSEPGIALDPHDRSRILAVYQGRASGA